MDTTTYTAIRVQNKTMSLQQLLQRLRINPAWADPDRCKRDLVLICWAESEGLTAANSDLQSAFTQFRRVNKLYTSAQANAWLEVHGMRLEDLIDILKPQVLHTDLARHVISEDRIRQRFIESASLYDTAEISRIATNDFGIAQELLFQVEDGADFHVLARKYSTDLATAKSGGYAGVVSRADLESEVAAAVFSAAPGDILGPFERKREFSLIYVEALSPAELNADVEARIREELFLEQFTTYQASLDIHEFI
ncbi:peptidylprolyl isomerase [Paenibacillus ferrarius]|uniref:peptidylprolyl isomerase n=1 Tax=Paenibacillus ferrarius TaxID=1469647 RepID=UPI003D267380